MVAEPSHAEEPEGLVEEQESPASPTTTDKSIRIDAHVKDDAYPAYRDTGTQRRNPWGRSFVYFLTVGMATVLFFTLLCELQEAASGRLPGHKEGKDYRGFSRLSSSVMRSRSTREHEQQQQVKDAHSHPPASEEEASPLPSVSTVTPPPSEDPLSLHDAWGLPMLDHFERTLPPDVKQGKDAIAEWLAKGHTGDEKSPSRGTHEVAIGLSNGSSRSLVGMNLLLRNVMPLHWVEGDWPRERLVCINRLLGEGGTAIVVEAEDKATHEVFAMRVMRIGGPLPERFKNDDSFILHVQEHLQFEEERARQLCGMTPASEVGSKKGIVVPRYIAEVAGVPEGQRSGDYIIMGRVVLMEMFRGDMFDLFDHAEIVEKAREYIARRLLLIVLKIQQAGVSHNDLKWENLLMRADGSFLVSDLTSSLPFGRPFGSSTAFTPLYLEPQLFYSQGTKTDETGRRVPHASSDLWSLGILLHYLFTLQQYPYGIFEAETELSQSEALAMWLEREMVRSASLEPDLEAAKVPSRWKKLILRLLEPSRGHRITAWEIIEEFPDLVHNPE